MPNSAGGSSHILKFPEAQGGISGKYVGKTSSADMAISSETWYNINEGSERARGVDTDMDLEKYIDRLDQDRRDMEVRITEERRLSEERIEKRSAEFEERLEKRFVSIDQRFATIDQRFDRMEDKLDKVVENVRAEGSETKRWMIALCIATILGIAAMVITVMVK